MNKITIRQLAASTLLWLAACIVAALASKLAASPVRVDMNGGSLTIAWAPGEPIRMRGKATHVFSGELDLDALQ